MASTSSAPKKAGALAPLGSFAARVRRALGKAFRYLRLYGVRALLRKVRTHFKLKSMMKRHADTPLTAPQVAEADGPVFSILVPLYNTPLPFLREMIDSVTSQSYPRFELCLADGSDGAHSEVGDYCRARAEADGRILYRKLDRNGGISENTNAAIDMATGDIIALFDHDDLLHPDALREMKAAFDRGADFVYTDEATFESPDRHRILSVHYKPSFAPDDLRANNYICHFSAFRREVLNEAGRFRSAFDGSQDHDMILRLTEKAKHIVHIPRVLYLWRSHPLSVAMDISSKTYAIDAGRRAALESIRRAHGDAKVESSRAYPTIYRFRYAIPEGQRVSILLPYEGSVRAIRRVLDAIRKRTAYPHYDILVPMDEKAKDANEAATVARERGATVLPCAGKTAAARISLAAQAASGSYLVLLSSTAIVKAPRWIEELLMYAQREDVGAVGGLLVYKNGTVAHAGAVLDEKDGRITRPAFHRYGCGETGYMGRLCYARNVSVLTSDLFMIRRELFLSHGGLSEQLSVLADTDLCLSLRREGLLCVCTPEAVFTTLRPCRRNTFSPKADPLTLARFKEKWGEVLEKGDPYFNPNLYFRGKSDPLF